MKIYNLFFIHKNRSTENLINNKKTLCFIFVSYFMWFYQFVVCLFVDCYYWNMKVVITVFIRICVSLFYLRINYFKNCFLIVNISIMQHSVFHLSFLDMYISKLSFCSFTAFLIEYVYKLNTILFYFWKEDNLPQYLHWQKFWPDRT